MMGTTQMICANHFFRRISRRLLLAILLLAAVPNADAQAPQTQWVPRGEMIGAIIGFAATQCGKLDDLFVAQCKDPAGRSVARHLEVRAALASLSDAELRDLCRKHGISECQTQEETSRGQSILVLDMTVAVVARISSWSSDNRFLLFQDGRPELRILDAASGQLLDKTLQMKRSVDAFAWSPDSKLAAITSLGELRLLSVGTWEEVGFRPTKEGCRLDFQRYMAFTANSRSLWVLCGDALYSLRSAQKLSVPELKLEDEMSLSPTPGAERTYFSARFIARHGDDVILTGEATDLQLRASGGVTALNLTRKLPVYPPLPGVFIRHSGDLSRVLLLRSQPTDRLQPKGAINVPMEWAIETWDTASGKQIGSSFGGTTDADSIYRPFVPVPMSNLLISVYGKKTAARWNLVVMDDRSGAVLQEIGPMPRVNDILVSPDGTRAALRVGRCGPEETGVRRCGSEETRIYKINRSS
jgi:hypothetical protein